MEKNNSKVSVIIPVFNVEKYLSECLNSVICQTLKEIEIICINDGSTDGSLEILKEFEKKDSRIILIDKENEGVGKTRNLGILKAQAEFVVFMDPDDFYPTNDILEALYVGAKENNVLICGGEFSNYVDGKIIQDYKGGLSGYLFEKDGIIDYKDYQFDFGFHRFIYNRDFLIKNNIFYPPYKRFQDPPFFVKAMIKAQKFYALDKITYGYRLGHNTVKWDKGKVLDNLMGIRDVMQIAKENKMRNLFKIISRRCQKDYLPYFGNNFSLLAYFELIKITLLDSSMIWYFLKTFFRNFFAIKNDSRKTHKIITILGFKIKIRRMKNNNE